MGHKNGDRSLGLANQEGRWLLGFRAEESLWAIVSHSYQPQPSLNNH